MAGAAVGTRFAHLGSSADGFLDGTSQLIWVPQLVSVSNSHKSSALLQRSQLAGVHTAYMIPAGVVFSVHPRHKSNASSPPRPRPHPLPTTHAHAHTRPPVARRASSRATAPEPECIYHSGALFVCTTRNPWQLLLYTAFAQSPLAPAPAGSCSSALSSSSCISCYAPRPAQIWPCIVTGQSAGRSHTVSFVRWLWK